MKKIISLGAVLLMIFVVGCSYISPVPPESFEEEGVTYIDLVDLVEDTSEDVVEEEPSEEGVVEEVKEVLTLKVDEGVLVSFPNLEATDPDGDKITYTFSQPLNPKGEWQTEEGDAGEYTVTITVSDGASQIKQDVMIIVEEVNKDPVLEKIKDIVVKEGETVALSPKALDPEGKPITITYSGWMTSDTKELDYNSAGDYIVRVTVSDGVNDKHQDVKVTVEDVNRPPTFVSII
ncbi:hypothetical protein CEE44_00710 [Candidatus Woesearchaeota archaeon B3_Woes]|nr:MAG: hypothetical protein CEE44_00710 [Candidatus Woesearchaeota archaeon B3_Woes]